MTPHELNMYILLHNERRKIEHQEHVTMAFLTAYLHRVKRIPSLKSLLDSPTKKRAQTDREMLENLKAINASMGGHVVIRESPV